jgi:hypothetical protein
MNENDVEALEAARKAAMLCSNVAALDELLAEDLSWVHASSKVDDKLSFLRGFSSGSLRCYRLDYRDTRIRIFGSVAVVSGTVDMDVEVANTRRCSVGRYVGLWAHQQGQTKLVHWQSTRSAASGG